jgi:TolB-like protein/tetratricopeptide (TPR) repeat protein
MLAVPASPGAIAQVESSELSSEVIRAALDTVLGSSTFAGSDRLRAFLRFVVEETLEGHECSLKESVIGNNVYGREPAYDPRIDSTVRVEARRLRSKLDLYYAGDGHADAVRISLPTGRYVPAFSPNLPAAAGASKVGGEEPANIFEKGHGAAVAVMPFQALCRDPEAEGFASGLTDELTCALVAEKGLRILSQLAVLPYKDSDLSPAQIAAKLGVVGVLQGVVRRDSDMLRVTIEYSNSTGFIVFSDRFDVPLSRRARLQKMIAATVVSRSRFDSSKMRAMQLTPTAAGVEAHAKVYRARQLMDRQTPAALSEALEMFMEISRSAPDYARGHSGVADCYCEMFRIGMVDRLTALESAGSAACRAREIDPDSVEAHTALATVSAWLERDRPAAEAYFKRALELGRSARASRFYGVFLTIGGRHEEAEERLREARLIEPFSIQQDIAEALALYQSRRFEILTGRPRDPEDDPLPGEAIAYVALAHIFGGCPEGAGNLVREMEAAPCRHADIALMPAEIEAWLGSPRRARRLLDRPMDQASCFGRATLAAALGERERALDELAQAIQRRELSTAWMGTDARFDCVRDLPPFQQMLERLPALASAAAA